MADQPKPKPLRKRLYYIVDTNCDCCSSTTAVLVQTRRAYGPRCPHCRRILGPMQYRVINKVRARGDVEAMRVWDGKRLPAIVVDRCKPQAEQT